MRIRDPDRAGTEQRRAPTSGADRLELAGHDRLTAASKIVADVLLTSAAAGARTTLRALDPSTPSGAFLAPSGSEQVLGTPLPV